MAVGVGAIAHDTARGSTAMQIGAPRSCLELLQLAARLINGQPYSAAVLRVTDYAAENDRYWLKQ